MDQRIHVVIPSLTIVTMALLLSTSDGGWLDIACLLIIAASVVWINVLHFRAARPSEAGEPADSEKTRAAAR